MAREQSEELNRVLNETTEYIKNVEYPAHKRDLVAAASGEGAPARVMIVLESLPDKMYQSHNDLVSLFIDPDEGGDFSGDEWDPLGY
ncbi:MAG: DUF2795 domain-containing protein [Bradymonadaceae bacterium]